MKKMEIFVYQKEERGCFVGVNIDDSLGIDCVFFGLFLHHVSITVFTEEADN